MQADPGQVKFTGLRQCARCQREIQQPPGRGRPRRFCSEACQRSVYRAALPLGYEGARRREGFQLRALGLVVAVRLWGFELPRQCELFEGVASYGAW